MFNSRRSFSGNRFSGGGQSGGSRGPRQFSRFRGRPAYGRGRQPSFDPTNFVQNITYKPEQQEEYVSKHQFNELEVVDQLKKNIIDRGYTKMTPIQDQAIEPILQGKDVVGVANTGTGKTAAFLIPLINRAFKDRSIKVLIVTPTRELAIQIRDEFKLFSAGMQIFSALIIGGAAMGRQIDDLRRRPEFVIGTPGRLKDLEQRRKIFFNDYKAIVLDEVDRMLDMGFIGDIQEMIAKLPRERHSLFFSATIPVKARGIMANFLNDPIYISVESKQQTAESVNQQVVKLSGRAKVEVLHDLLIQKGFDKVLVFGRTKWGMEKLGKELRDKGFRVASIHGNKTQFQRQQALKQFKSGGIQVLLATDLASRGLDIDNVTHVINYDLPSTFEDYVHRIGRTGRAEKRGIALTLVD